MFVWKQNANDYSHYATCLFLPAHYFITESFRKPVSSAAALCLSHGCFMYHLESKYFTLQTKEMLNKNQVCRRVHGKCVLSEWSGCLIQLISNEADIVFALGFHWPNFTILTTVHWHLAVLLFKYPTSLMKCRSLYGLSLCFGPWA